MIVLHVLHFSYSRICAKTGRYIANIESDVGASKTARPVEFTKLLQRSDEDVRDKFIQ